MVMIILIGAFRLHRCASADGQSADCGRYAQRSQPAMCSHQRWTMPVYYDCSGSDIIWVTYAVDVGKLYRNYYSCTRVVCRRRSVYTRFTQWRTLGFWHPGQEVESAPLFTKKITHTQKSKMVDPKLISVIFESEKQK